ncbi:DUF6541 family protein [Micromonospora sp. NPDC049366]|uniref:DUF6541 family protein n=1 Tax=Micromonospora sp. NPDC049366 TaxID=3364271 RepID=UPI0037AFFADD
MPRKADRRDSSAPSAGGRPTLADWIAVAVLLSFIPILHDLKGMLTAPYWLDESWVALSVRFPLGDLAVTTASTPIGWSLLLRLVPDPEYLRVVPLAFHGLSVGVAYALGRLVDWRTRRLGIVAGLVSGAAVLLLPAQQVRHDLKQYTADAAVTLGLLALTCWTERTMSRGRLGVLAAATGIGMLLSHLTAVAAVCVFAGLLLATAIRRRPSQLLEVTVAGLGAATIVAAVYFGFSAQARSETMQQFWDSSFPEAGELPDYIAERADVLTPLLGVPALTLVVLFVAGALTLMLRGRTGSATAVLLLPITATVLGVLRVYPLLDPRTSHFLLVTGAAVGGIGVTGLVSALVGLVRHALPRTPPTVVTATICAVLVGVFAVNNSHWYRSDEDGPQLRYTPVTDVRSATEYVAKHRSTHDVVVVSHLAWYGFAFYSGGDELSLHAPYGNTVGWWVDMPTRPDVVGVPSVDAASIRAALDRALELAVQRGGARIWLIRSYVVGAEAEAWRSVLADFRVEQVTDGVEPVVLISER